MLGGETSAAATCIDAEDAIGDWRRGRIDQSGSCGVGNARFRKPRTQARQHRHRSRRVAVVVPDQRVETVGIGADDGDRARRGAQRQQVAGVPEQDHALLGGAQRQRAMFVGVVIVGRDRREDARGRIELAEAHARGEQAAQGGVDRGSRTGRPGAPRSGCSRSRNRRRRSGPSRPGMQPPRLAPASPCNRADRRGRCCRPRRSPRRHSLESPNAGASA